MLNPEFHGLQGLACKGDTQNAVEGLKDILHGFPLNLLQFLAHFSGVGQEKNKASPCVHNASHAAQAAFGQNPEPDGSGQHLHTEGTCPQKLACAPVALFSPAKDEVLYARKFPCNQKKGCFPELCCRLIAHIESLRYGCSCIAVIIETYVCPGAIGR